MNNLPRRKVPKAQTALTASLAKTLRALRHKRGLTLEDAALKSGLSMNMLSLWELGEYVPTLPVLFRLADAYGTPLANLVRNAERRMHETKEAAR